MAAKRTESEDRYRQFKADLKAGTFRRMYILFGEEHYLLETYRRQLRGKLTDGPAADFNLHIFQEENWSVDDFAEAVEAIPMMSETSLIEIVDVNPFSRPDAERKTLAELFSSLPDYLTVVLIFDTVEWNPDKRMKSLYAAMDASALQVEFAKQPETQLIPWIRRHLAASGKTMSDALCRYLILQTGGSMTVLAAELEKLVSYTDQAEINRNDIEAVVIPVTEAAVFDITKDIGAKNFDQALLRLRDLLRQDVEPISINAIIGRQLRQLYAAKVLSEHGKGPAALKQLCGIWDSLAREIYSQANGFRKETLREGMLLAAQTDYALKTSGGEKDRLLEMLILRLARNSGEV